MLKDFEIKEAVVFFSLLYKKNRFHVAARQFSNRSSLVVLYSEARDPHAANKIEKVYKNIWTPIRINYRVKCRDFPGNYVICIHKNRKLASARPSSRPE